MATTYDYTYEYEVTDSNKNNRSNAAGHHTNRNAYGLTVPPSSRTNPSDPLANLQHDRIWHKLYDPLSTDKASHEVEIQVCVGERERSSVKSLSDLFSLEKQNALNRDLS